MFKKFKLLLIFLIIAFIGFSLNKNVDKDINNEFNYLAIGNSITQHGICDYWWNKHGMAASKEDKDYVHLVKNGIEDKIKERKGKERKGKDISVTALAYNYYLWEVQALDRAETYLSDKINLITIQLGENVVDKTTLKEDFVELIKYIKVKAPNAKILLIGEFWKDDEKDAAKRYAAELCKIDFIDLSQIQNLDEYKAGIGTAVFDKNGNKHIIEHKGVAEHPNDKGMEFIANSILDKI